MPPTSTAPTAPLTPAQARLWFLHRLDPASLVHNQGALWRIDGPLDVDALVAALDAATVRQPMLRTRFPHAGGVPVQCVDGPARAAVEFADLPGADDGGAALDVAARERCRVPFDLAAAPPVRWTLFALGPGRHALLRVWHHIIGDALTERALGNDLRDAYALARAGAIPALPPLALDFHDYARRVAQEAALPEVARELDDLRARFADAPTLALATDFGRPPVASLRGDRVVGRVPAAACDAFVGAARALGVPPGTAFLGAWAFLLARLSARTDLVVGLAARPLLDRRWSDVLGLFARLVPARIDLAGATDAAEGLRRVRTATHAALGGQRVAFERLVEALGLPRDPSRHPLCQATFTYRQGRRHELVLEGCRVEQGLVHPGSAAFDLGLALAHDGGGVETALEFATDLVERATAERMLRQYGRVVEAVARDPLAPIAALPLMDEGTRRAVLSAARGAPAHPSGPATLTAAFAARVAASPHAIALPGLAYRELADRARSLAAALRPRGAGPGQRVAVACERADERIAGWLAVLATGAACVPFDGDVPDARLAAMVEDADLRLVVADAAAASRFRRAGVAVVGPDEGAGEASADPGPDPVRPDDAAFLFFTSGSTGRPKGIVVPHAAIVHLARDSDYATLGADDVVGLLASPAFDASSFEVWGALLNGARLAPIPKATAIAPVALAAAIEREGVTALFVTTALFEAVARDSPSAFARVGTVLFGGEACDPRLVARVLHAGPPRRLVHVYGPTETTTFATAHRVERVDERAAAVPIGRAIAGAEVHVLRDDGEPAAPGEPGEIVIGGRGVASGYLAAPADGAARFVELAPGGGAPRRFYRSGDRGWRRDDGAIVFLGRADGQVKVRGHRIELGEVEAALSSLPGVAAAAAILLGDTSDTRRIAACLVAADRDAPPPSDVRRRIRALLPAYMLPAEVAWFPALPLNANGKVDRAALAAAIVPSAEGIHRHEPPRDSLETDIARRWEALLGRTGLGLRDRFFELGGHSLLAARFAAEYERDTGFAFPLGALFVDDSVLGAADAVRLHALGANAAIGELHGGGARVPLVYVHGDFMAGGFHGHLLARWLGPDQPLLLVHPHGVADRTLPSTIEAMAADRVRALREMRPHGPYVVGGHCNGAFVAIEMARRLREEGEAVAALVLVDAWYPGTRQRSEADAAREVLDSGSASQWDDRMRDLALRLYRAMLAYRPGPVDCPLVVLRSRDGAAAAHDGDWPGLAANVEVRELPGSHVSLVQEENAEVFAAALREVVARAERDLAAVQSA